MVRLRVVGAFHSGSQLRRRRKHRSLRFRLCSSSATQAPSCSSCDHPIPPAMESDLEASKAAARAVVGERFCSQAERELTVRKTSIFFSGDGFVAYDNATGDLVFRVETYARSGSPAFADRQILLMDPSGDPILTLRRKWPSLHQRWEAFLGERIEGQRPLFAVRRSSIFGSDRSGFEVEVNSNGYRIEGCFAKRCCRVIYERRGGDGGGAAVLAEIKRKVDTLSHVVFGRDVFSLCLHPHCDSAFAMGLVVVLDQIAGDEAEEEEEHVDSPIAEAAC